MTDISFYHLTASPLEKALPPLLLKILETGSRAVIRVKDDLQKETLDKLLWTFSTKKLLPHGMDKDAFQDEQPILIMTEEGNPNQADILVCLHEAIPQDLVPFKRCMDMFDGESESALENARNRWKTYQKMDGCSTTYWKQNAEGKWEKGA